jgi:hypothetical protein
LGAAKRGVEDAKITFQKKKGAKNEKKNCEKVNIAKMHFFQILRCHIKSDLLRLWSLVFGTQRAL